jgi:MoaA/NifB/PqqE/SkfB family radical SAM enzyme
LGILCGIRLNVQFTVDGVTEQEHTKYRQKTSLAKILSHMLTLTSTKATAGVYTVIFEHNEQSMQDIAKLCRDHGAHYITFVPSNRFHHDLNWYNKFKFVDEEGINQEFVRSNLKKPLSGPLNDTFIESLAHVL